MIGREGPRVHPILYLLIGVLGVLTLLILAPLWSFVAGGLLVGYLAYPLFRRLRTRFPRNDVAAALALILLATIILLPAGYLGHQLVLQTQSLAEGFTSEDAQRFLDSSAELSRERLGWPQVDGNQTAAEAAVEEGFPVARQAVLDWLPNAAGFLAEFGLGLTVVLFIGYYTLRDGHRLVRFVEDFLPLNPATEQRILDEVRNSLDAVVFGQVLTAVLQGTLAGIGFWLFGVPAPVLWGFLSAVLSFIPVIGPPLIWMPAGLFLVATGETARGVGLLVWGALLVSTLDNVVRPKIVSERSGMHPTIALLGVVGGLIAFGFMGFLLGPVVLALFLTLVGIYMEQRPEPSDEDPIDQVLERLAERGLLGPEPPTPEEIRTVPGTPSGGPGGSDPRAEQEDASPGRAHNDEGRGRV